MGKGPNDKATTPPDQPQIHSPLRPKNNHSPQSRELSPNIPPKDQNSPNSFSSISTPERERSPPYIAAESSSLDHMHQRFLHHISQIERKARGGGGGEKEPLSFDDPKYQYYYQVSQLGRKSSTDSYDQEIRPPSHQLSPVPLSCAPSSFSPCHLMPPYSSKLPGLHPSRLSTSKLKERSPDENPDSDELKHLENFAENFKRRRIQLGKF